MNKNIVFDKFDDNVSTTDNKNSYVTSHTEYYSNILELISAFQKLKSLITAYKYTDDTFQRKELGKEIKKLEFIVAHSKIQVNINKYYEIVSNIMFNYLEKFGFDKNFIDGQINDVNTSIRVLEELEVGKSYNAGHEISLDIKYASFDKTGNFIDIRDDKKGEVLHALCHECFHLISTGVNGIVTDVGINESMAEMFTCRALGSNKFRSKSYDFSVRICELFVEMLGEETVLNEYMHGQEQYESISSLFESSDDFKAFKSKLTGFIKDKDSPTIDYDKEQFLIKFRDKVVVPFCIKNSDKKENVIEVFNLLFKSNGVKTDTDYIENYYSSKK